MQFRTEVKIDTPDFLINPLERMLFVGSCFADNIGKRFCEGKFRAVVNPFGVMYNPVSILHTVSRLCDAVAQGKLPSTIADSFPPRVAVFTLGTNHVYRLKSTGEIVDNCQKRPQRLFQEEQLSVEQCRDALAEAVGRLQKLNPDVRVILTVSPIRYAKYGYHGSQLSKAKLLLAVDELLNDMSCCSYFPAYEIVNDELRDYRFYKEDMLHPTEQTVSYIWERLSEYYFSDATHSFLKKWKTISLALNHKPFNPESEEYQKFLADTLKKKAALEKEYEYWL